MSNDITALMATMKAAAEKAKHAGEAPVMDFNARIDALNEFQLAACPTNVQKLVEALEKAQQYAKERDEENQSLILTVGRLRVERESLASRTVTVKLPQRQEPTSSGHYGEGYLVPSYSGSALDYEDTIEALTAAGIQVIEGEGQ